MMTMSKEAEQTLEASNILAYWLRSRHSGRIWGF
jgi:hypothetical protein